MARRYLNSLADIPSNAKFPFFSNVFLVWEKSIELLVIIMPSDAVKCSFSHQIFGQRQRCTARTLIDFNTMKWAARPFSELHWIRTTNRHHLPIRCQPDECTSTVTVLALYTANEQPTNSQPFFHSKCKSNCIHLLGSRAMCSVACHFIYIFPVSCCCCSDDEWHRCFEKRR